MRRCAPARPAGGAAQQAKPRVDAGRFCLQGANYRLIDIPVSNCINSDINKIYCLTQFNSASLNRHLSNAYVRAPEAACAAQAGER
jgi:ADP-glucose pyrophosphorylase